MQEKIMKLEQEKKILLETIERQNKTLNLLEDQQGDLLLFESTELENFHANMIVSLLGILANASKVNMSKEEMTKNITQLAINGLLNNSVPTEFDNDIQMGEEIISHIVEYLDNGQVNQKDEENTILFTFTDNNDRMQ